MQVEVFMVTKKRKDAHAIALGRKGGLRRAKTLSTKELSAIGKKGAAVRWKKENK